MKRAMTKKVQCGSVTIGGGAPISIQSMTNTKTKDIAATVAQILALEDAGCEMVRCAVPDMESAEAFAEIKKQIHIPLVADIHFDYRLAIRAMECGADKIRINPGNIGTKDRISAVVHTAKERSIPIRIGVNAGSLEKDILRRYGGVTAEGIVESLIKSVEIVEDFGYDQLVLSAKCSDVQMNFDVHQRLADQLSYPLHIGITEAGTTKNGELKSAVGIGALLISGIGDTIRVSITGDPVQEMISAKRILNITGIRKTGITLISCPTCGRTNVDLEAIAGKIEELTKEIQQPLTVAIMGCEVNGPGESKEADIGLACGKGKGVIFKKGSVIETVPEEMMIPSLLRYIKEACL